MSWMTYLVGCTNFPKLWDRGVQIPDARLPSQLNFAHWHLLVNIFSLEFPSCHPSGIKLRTPDLGAISNFWVPEGWHEASIIIRCHYTKFSYPAFVHSWGSAMSDCGHVIWKICVSIPEDSWSWKQYTGPKLYYLSSELHVRRQESK